MSFPASFDSECDECDGAIFEGDLITKFYGGWVHEGCANEADEPAFRMWWD